MKHPLINFLCSSICFLVIGLGMACLVIFDEQTILANVYAFWGW
jgi:hypothetical protein